jgi:DNA-binding CsgD family transcriptional regulator
MELLERDAELAALSGALSLARAGTGTAIAVSGEPGAGKSVLVEAACAGVEDLRVLRGGCDPLATPRPLGPIRDLFDDLVPLAGSVPLADICEAVYAELRAHPTVLVVEDLHWVDAASVEVLRFLVRRSEAMPSVLVVTYRDDEIDATHSARPLLGDFAVLEHLTTLRLAPLTVEGVAKLLAGTGLDIERVHALTAGNPFFATEVAKDPDARELPETVRDAVLARTTGIAPEDFEVLQLAAAAPDRLDDRLLPALGVDLPTLRRLHATGLLMRNRHGLLFRHELARLALESTIPAGGLTRLHARILDALERIEPRDPAVLTHHAVAAADSTRAVRYAREAAEQAARAGAHTEAAAFFQIAVAHHQGDAAERATLLTRMAYEQYMTNRLDAAIETVTSTFPVWQAAGDPVGLSSAHEMCAVFEYYNARRYQAEEHVERAMSLAGDAGLEYAAARLTLGYLAYMRSDHELAVACNLDGDRIGRELDDHSLLARSRVVRAATDLAQGAEGGRERLVSSIETARGLGFDELASTGYSNLVYLDVEQRRLGAAERVLEESLQFTIERDIPICNHWQTSVRARLRFLEGQWNAALEDAEDCLSRTGMPLADFWPYIVEGLVALRTTGSDDGRIEDAWRLADQLGEPLRRIPALAALAERWWLTGTPDPRVSNAAALLGQSTDGSAATSWVRGELAVWLGRLGLPSPIDPAQVAEPYRLSMTGQHREAASWWRQSGAVFEQGMALADSAESADRIRGIERLDLLGATATADRLRRLLREEGVEHVPPRPLASTRANPAGLTNRQLDVAKLVARGFTNAEIAERLFISVKTADHHVSAVLMKLGVPNRRAVVVQAAELGLA